MFFFRTFIGFHATFSESLLGESLLLKNNVFLRYTTMRENDQVNVLRDRRRPCNTEGTANRSIADSYLSQQSYFLCYNNLNVGISKKKVCKL